MISAHYGMSDVFDNLVISLCKFTTLLSSAEVCFLPHLLIVVPTQASSSHIGICFSLHSSINIFDHPVIRPFLNTITPTIILTGIHFLPKKDLNSVNHFMIMTYFTWFNDLAIFMSTLAFSSISD